MYDLPTDSELLAAVADFLREEVSPQLSGRLAFHARVAVNVIEMVRRRMRLGPGAERRAAARIAALLGHDGPLAELEAELCEAIAAGAFAHDDPALIEHLWASTLDTLAVEQPGYGTYRHAARLFDTDKTA